MFGLPRRWRAGVVGLSAVLTLGAVAPGVKADPAAGPDVVGQWTQPFEENGAATPRCQPARDDSTFVVCKPTAVEAAVLGDGRVFYVNGLESQENAEGPTLTSLAPSSRDSQARLLDLRTGTPQWSAPAENDGDQFCSDITALPNGKLLLAGGPAELEGQHSTWLFDPQTSAFEPGGPMKYGRWYPHVVIGADGSPTVFGGVTQLVSDTQLGNVRRTE
ncbi:MAG: hypothetical protein LC792_10780, partial [Actinobacteria bacterium]|nr:hypothetical protein [Actinomycetota bacterium]